MGACTSTINCKGKKYQKQPRATIVKRPSIKDFSLDEEDILSSPHMHSTTLATDQRLGGVGVQITEEKARVGVKFQFDELAVAKFRKQLLQQSNQSLKRISLNLESLRPQVVPNGRLEKWQKMVSYKLDPEFVDKVIVSKGKSQTDSIEFSKYAKIGLTNFYETYPELFLSRVSKGPPPQYRWLAWKVAIAKNLQKTKGLYEELLQKKPDKECMYDIKKDLNRSFPGHPYYDKEKFGDIGQKSLMHVLQAYSIFNQKVGYCQSMNFVVGFILLINGGNEREAFWFFAQLTKPSQQNQQNRDTRIFDQYDCVYRKNFPLLLQYLYQFDVLFEQFLPKLYLHFQNEMIPPMLWLGKWFTSLFILSFPISLCIRIWDNILVHGSIYIFQVSLAILKLIEQPLLICDLDGINQFLKSFKDDELAADQGGQLEGAFNTHLPADDLIIEESLRIKIDQEFLERSKQTYKQSLPQKEKKKIKNVEKLQLQEIERQKQTRSLKRMKVAQNGGGSDSQNGEQSRDDGGSQGLQQIKEEKIVMEDFKYSEEDVDRQEDQQARSSENQQIGGSSGGANAELSSGGQLQKLSQFNPTIVTYDGNQKQSSMKMRMTHNSGSTRMLVNQNGRHRSEKMQVQQPMINNCGASAGGGNGSSGLDDKASATLSINRFNMVFAQTTIQVNKDEKSLTHKNSSDNISIHNSIADPGEYIGGLNRVPSNSSYLNKITHSNIQFSQAVESRKKKPETLANTTKVKSVGIPPLANSQSNNTVSSIQNLYQYQHQLRLKKSEFGGDDVLRDVELEQISEDEQNNHEDESRGGDQEEEEDDDDPDLSRDDPDEDEVQRFNNRDLMDEDNGFEIPPPHSHSHTNSIRKFKNNLVGARNQNSTQFDQPHKIKRDLYLSTLDNPKSGLPPLGNTTSIKPAHDFHNQQSFTTYRKDDAAGSERATPLIVEEAPVEQKSLSSHKNQDTIPQEDESKRRVIGKKKKKKVAKKQTIEDNDEYNIDK